MNESRRVLVLAPTPRDSLLSCETFQTSGIEAVAMQDMTELCHGLVEGAGAALVTEDHLRGGALRQLERVLQAQPPWSDFPLLVLGRRGGAQDNLLDRLGNVILLEQPVRMRSLVRAGRSALRMRERQYRTAHEIEERDRFLALLGHELRNPLSAMQLAVEVAMRSDDPGQKLGVMRRQVVQLKHIVDDLLDVARVSAGKIELRREPLDLAFVIEDLEAAFRGRFEAAGLALQVQATPGTVIDCDRTRIDQIFANLLANALKYTPRGGRVDVTVMSEDGFAVVEVQDTGVGIPQRMVSRIFEEFVQVEPSLARSRGGMGLGLTLVRRLVELHGGIVRVQSDGPGLGSTFKVRFPLAAIDRSGKAVEVDDNPTVPTANRKEVLVVEDNLDSQELLVELIREHGHSVRAASDGQAGLEAILDQHRRPDAAIVDIGLPKMDGYELARRVRLERGADVLLIALSGYGQPEDRRRALEAGFDVHLTKPPDLYQLTSLLEGTSAG